MCAWLSGAGHAERALVHDNCRPWEKKTGKSHFGPEALQIIRQVLTNSQVNVDIIEPILEVVKRHDIHI